MSFKLNTSKDAPPLFIQIKNDIKRRIEEGHWKPGDKIPSEIELCKYYDVSRITVREAINELVWENYLVRKRAKGTFVLDKKEREPKKDYSTLVKSHAYEMNEIGKEATTYYADVKKIKATDTIARELEIPVGSDVIQLKRLRGVNNEYPIYFKTYWKYEPYFSLNTDKYYGSFYELLNNHGIKITKIKEYLEAITPSDEVKEKLNIPEGKPVLKRVRKATNTERTFIEYSECYYVGENYRYYIHLDLIE